MLRNIFTSYNLGESVKDHQVIEDEQAAEQEAAQTSQDLANQQVLAQINQTNAQTQAIQRQTPMSM